MVLDNGWPHPAGSQQAENILNWKNKKGKEEQDCWHSEGAE